MGRLTLLWAPVVALVVSWIGVLAVAITLEHPLWGLQPRNLAEAAAFRDGAAIVRRVSAGEDVNAAGEVREGFIGAEPVTITPLAAAARLSREEIVRLLVDLGAGATPASWTDAWCASSSDAVRKELTGARPAGAPTECR